MTPSDDPVDVVRAAIQAAGDRRDALEAAFTGLGRIRRRAWDDTLLALIEQDDRAARQAIVDDLHTRLDRLEQAHQVLGLWLESLLQDQRAEQE